jgi:DNA-directed RNA polymerase specialized sigma24 family protein
LAVIGPGGTACLARHHHPSRVRPGLRAAHKPQTGWYVLDAEDIAGEQAVMAEEELLKAERHAALREALTYLPPSCQQLIAMLIQDPPVPYVQISAELGIPVGSIGPIRRRCLAKLRQHPAIAALIDAETGRTPGRLPGETAVRH